MGLNQKEEEALNIMISVLDSRIRWLSEHTPYAVREIRNICDVLTMLIDMDFLNLKRRRKINLTKSERDELSIKIARKEIYREERSFKLNENYANNDGTLKDNKIVDDIHKAAYMYENGEIIECHDALLKILNVIRDFMNIE